MCGCVRKLRFSRIYNNLLRTLMLIIFGFANINNGLTSDIHKDKLDDTLQQHQIDNQQQQEHHNKIINQNLIMSHISNLDTNNNDDNIMPKIRQYNNNNNNNNLKETEILNNNNGASSIGGGTNSANSGSGSSSSSSIIIGSNSGSNISGRISGSSSGNSNSRNDKNIIINNSNSQIINENIIDNLNTELNNNNNNNNNFNNMDNNKQTDSSMLDDIYNTPMYFGTDNATVVTTQIGATAHMPCTIHHIGDGVVSWIRRKDYHLLTVGLTTYNSDERFSATHLKHSEDWTLQIKFVQLRDAGIYECQVSTHPPTSIFLHLSVVEARAEISGPPIRYLTPGSTLRLQCRVLQNTQPSEFIFWYHDNRMINYDIDRGINVSTETDFQSSELVILKTRREHSGNFTCLASNAQPASVLVHIFKGDNPAAMYHGHVGSSNKSYQNQLLIKLLLIFSITKTFLCHNSFSPLNIIKSV